MVVKNALNFVVKKVLTKHIVCVSAAFPPTGIQFPTIVFLLGNPLPTKNFQQDSLH